MNHDFIVFTKSKTMVILKIHIKNMEVVMTYRIVLKHIIAITIGIITLFSLIGCAGAKETSAQSEAEMSDISRDLLGAYPEEITYTMGRKIVQNPRMPKGDTYENNAYTRYIKERLNAVCINEFETMAEDYDRQVALVIASGDLPDIMHVASREHLNELVENDLIADLTDVYAKYSSQHVKDVYDSYEGRALEPAMYNGRLMALPGTNVDSAPNQIWIREDWMEELGIVIDKDGDACITLEELEMVAREFLDKDPGKSGDPVAIPLTNWLNVDDYNLSTFCMTGIASVFGAYPKLWLQNDEGEVYYGSNASETKEALGVLQKWYKDGILDPQFGTRTWNDISDLYINGQTGIAFGVWHTPDWLLNNVRSKDAKASFVTYTLEDKDGKVNVFHNNAAGAFMVVRKDYDYPELAIKISNLFHDEIPNSKTLEIDAPEVAQYQKDSVDGSVRPFDIVVNKGTSLLDDYSEMCQGVKEEITLDEVSTVESRVTIGSVKRYLENPVDVDVADWAKYHSRMKGVALIDKLTKEDKFNWVEPVFWGITDTMKTKGEKLEKLEEEMFIKIVTGFLPLDEFDGFVQEWHSQGGAQIIEEIEASLSADKKM